MMARRVRLTLESEDARRPARAERDYFHNMPPDFRFE
jgi:hypothetical protein